MKYLIIALIVFVCGSLKPVIQPDEPCKTKMEMRFYLRGHLVNVKADTIIQEVGTIIGGYRCVSKYNDGKGKCIRADSVVTTLK